MVPDFSIARRDELLALLEALRGVAQPVRYHPEGDALFHSLPVFEQAGTAIDGKTHDEVGADLLAGLVSERVIWLVRHHLDLLREPKRTRRAHHGTAALADLECLRRWDLAGRRPRARVLATEDAVELWLDQENERNSFADIDP